MTHYMLAVHAPSATERSDVAPPQAPDPDTMAAHVARIEALEARMREEGAWTVSARLHDPSSATVVRREGGRTVLTDGPQVEAREHVAGFYVIEAADLDEALSWAEQVVDTIGMSSLEVRPLAGYAA